jgi:hypothetical protein
MEDLTVSFSARLTASAGGRKEMLRNGALNRFFCPTTIGRSFKICSGMQQHFSPAGAAVALFCLLFSS